MYLLSTYVWKSHNAYTHCILWRKGSPLSRAMLIVMSESTSLHCAASADDFTSWVVFFSSLVTTVLAGLITIFLLNLMWLLDFPTSCFGFSTKLLSGWLTENGDFPHPMLWHTSSAMQHKGFHYSVFPFSVVQWFSRFCVHSKYHRLPVKMPILMFLAFQNLFGWVWIRIQESVLLSIATLKRTVHELTSTLCIWAGNVSVPSLAQCFLLQVPSMMVLSFVITVFPPANIQKIIMWELIITLARITEQFSLLWQELKYIVYIRVWFFFWQYWRSRGSYLLWMCCTTELCLQLSARMFEGSFYEKSLYGGTQKNARTL